jgi:hypothetical protein
MAYSLRHHLILVPTDFHLQAVPEFVPTDIRTILMSDMLDVLVACAFGYVWAVGP